MIEQTAEELIEAMTPEEMAEMILAQNAVIEELKELMEKTLGINGTVN